jgi:threonine aldolase
MNPNRKLAFASDYMEGTHPQILKRLVETNMQHFTGYGMDDISESARDKIRAACEAPDAEVYFLVGGTQANATMIDAALRSYQGVIAANTGHISTHEAGAIELGGHKVLTLPQNNGKISAGQIRGCIEGYWQDDNHEHTVMPGLVYLSQPTEYGTLYSLEELTQISAVCHANNVALYVDGARLAYALACPENDVTLSDLASLCDAFYIGGTKCSALFGEAVVIPRRGFIPHLFTIIKQHGALLAKGWVAGLQFDTLFTDDLYFKVGKNAMDAANRIRSALMEKGYEFAFETPTNQIFIVLDGEKLAALSEKVEMGFWEKLDDNRTVMRIATSWATQKEDVDKLIECL